MSNVYSHGPLGNALRTPKEQTMTIDRDALAGVVRQAFRENGWVVPPSVGFAAADAVIAHLNLQAPTVPVEGEVEWEYRAKIGHIYGAARVDYVNAVLAAEEAYADYPFEVEDESVTVYRRPRLGWEVAP